MPVAFADNAIISDLAVIKRRLGIENSETAFDDVLTEIANEVSSTIENALLVNNNGQLYKGIIKQRTINNFVFTGSGDKNSLAPIYPIVSISSLQYTTNYVDWVDYTGPYVPNGQFHLLIPNSFFTCNASASRVSGVFGFSAIPSEIVQVFHEMVKLTADETNISKLGKNFLGKKSEGIGSQSQYSVSFEKQELNERQLKKIRIYKMPMFAQSVGVVR